MKPCKKALALLLMTVLMTTLAAGCKSKDQNNSSSGISDNSQVSENSGTGTGNNDKPTLYIFNSSCIFLTQKVKTQTNLRLCAKPILRRQAFRRSRFPSALERTPASRFARR